MSEGWQVICFAAAFVAFVLAAVLSALSKAWTLALVSAGLAFWVLVALWNANALYD